MLIALRLSAAMVVVLASWPAPSARTAQGPPPPAAPEPPRPDRWEPPPEEKIRTNPVAATPEASRRGKFLYQKHCMSCHGAHGKGDGPASSYWGHVPEDLTDPERQARLTDGEIFWKITHGRKADGEVIMPGFMNSVPSEEDRWKVVLYVRSLGQQAR